MSHDLEATKEVEMAVKVETSPFGLWTGLGLWLGTILITFLTAGYGPVFSAIGDFFTGRPQGLDAVSAFDVSALLFIVAMVSIALPTMFVTMIFVSLVHRGFGGHAILELLMSGKKNLFKIILLTVVLEEVVTRWLFLGLLTQLFNGAVAYYVLFLVSNLLFAYAHIFNFKKKSDRRLLRVLPQFVGGIFFAITFTKYGLFAAILLHFAFNTALFAIYKKQSLGQKNLYALVCSAAMLVAGVVFFDQQLADTLRWLQPTGGFALSGWVFVDYMMLMFIVSGCIGVLAELLAYDRYEIDDATGLKELLIGMPLVPLLYVGLLWVSGFVISNQIVQVLAVGLLTLCIVKPLSPNHCSRMFWINLPELFVLLCAVVALGFWQGLLLVVSMELISVIQTMGGRNNTKSAIAAP